MPPIPDPEGDALRADASPGDGGATSRSAGTTDAQAPTGDAPQADGARRPGGADGRRARDADAMLVAAAQAGDRGALEALLDRHLDLLFTVALRIVGREEDAQDVVQEAVVRIWRQLPRFRGDARFSTWAYRIVTNVALDVVRRPDREVSVAQLPDLEVVAVGPERQLLLAEELDRVSWAMSQLSAEQRAALVLAELVQLPQHEIAEVLDTTISGVKNRLYRARSRLLKLLEDGELPPDGA